jgi:Tol biopolymer transport system component
MLTYVNKAAIAFGLAGFAAAGAVSTLTGAPSAPAGATRTAKVECSPGSHAGQAVQKTVYLKVNGKRPPDGRAYLKSGDRVRTTALGTARICLQAGGTTCDLEAGTRVQVLPSSSELALLSAGSITCKTRAGKPIQRDFKTAAQTIKLNALGLANRGDGGRAAAIRSADPVADEGHLFSIAVRGRRTVVKVRRGATVVSRLGNLPKAVVVGLKEQVVVSAAQDPSQPSTIQLTTHESRTFQQLQELLPPVRDQSKPGAEIVETPPDPSSTRRPRFTFASNESAAVFSCSLDGGVFRLCSNPQRFDTIDPGAHRLAVTATDPTGNIGSPDVFQWTIDASMIAFTSERDGNREIYVMYPDGKHQTRLTNQPAVDAAPSWSPDAKRIAFHSERDGNAEIYVMNADGSNQRRLTTNPSFDLNPTWSPDGKQIAFESARDGNSEIYVMNADGSDTRRLTTDPAVDFDPAWSPDGTRIAFASGRHDGNYDIYVMGADGSNPIALTADRAVDFNPAWSPDSRKIAFHSDRDGASSQIYVMNDDGTDVTRLTFTRASDYNPVWAPDGVTLAFQSNLDGNDDIYIINVDGTDLTKLTEDPSADLSPDW